MRKWRKCKIFFLAAFLFLSAPDSASASGKKPDDKRAAELKKIPADVAPFSGLGGKVEVPLPLQIRDVEEKCDCPIDEAIKALKNK